MLKIRAIRIEVNTSGGLFGREFTFTEGLNIIRGNNSAGKSSLFQSILYGLGLEELLGGRNEKTMQSVLKDQVEFPKDRFHNVLQSFIYLEIENTAIVTIKRSVISEYRKPQLVDVFYGPLLTGDDKTIASRPMFIHDKGGATDDIYGFHLFLSEFLNWELPETLTNKGEMNKMYLQQIAPSFIIEQKSGWSDFFATMPYYSMRNAESRVIEFLLDLDVFENEKRKQQINARRHQLTNSWSNLYTKMKHLADKSGGVLVGLEENPGIINDYNSIFISMTSNEKQITLIDYYELQKVELQEVESTQVGTVGENAAKNEIVLNVLTEQLNEVSLNYEVLSPELNQDKEKLRQYYLQLDSVKEDLRKNKGALKVKSLGAELPAETALDLCPTCHQELSDSLLPIDIKLTPMRLEDNISFLDAQQKMIEIYIEGQEKAIRDKENTLAELQSYLTSIRQQMRDIKKELVQDERMPSIVEIERRLNLRKRVEFFAKVIQDFSVLLEELKILSGDYGRTLALQSNLAKDFFSHEDRMKLADLQESFISLLKKFNYQSKPFNAIRISTDSYLPVAQKLIGAEHFYNIKFDSSASDFIRCIWAYTTALLKTSVEFQTNHPRLLILDEPKQQDISIDNFRDFLKELSKFKEQQILVFASFENSDSSFEETTQDIDFKLIHIENKLIEPISSI